MLPTKRIVIFTLTRSTDRETFANQRVFIDFVKLVNFATAYRPFDRTWEICVPHMRLNFFRQLMSETRIELADESVR